MCYSARLRQKFNELASEYAAEVDWEAFESFYERRAQGEKLKMSRDVQRNYQNPVTDVQKRTHAYIAKYLKDSQQQWTDQVFVQRARRTAAEESLKNKETKKTREELRIATNKEQQNLAWLADSKRREPNKEDARIFPNWYAPVIAEIDGRRLITPMRYACRLAGQSPSFEKGRQGVYNARRDNLDDYWKNIYGRRHAVMIVDGFYENVPKHLYEHRELAPDEKVENVVLEYDPRPSQDLITACIWDHWSGRGEPDLNSFAAVTDDPPPEISATGHQRCIVALQHKNLDKWLRPQGLSHEELQTMLSERQKPFYEHAVAA